MMRFSVVLLLCWASLPLGKVAAEPAAQPFRAQVRRLQKAMESLGEPWSANVQQRLDQAMEADNAVVAIQSVLDPLCLALVDVNAESRVKVIAGQAPKRLVQHGWTSFLVKVTNLGGVTAPLRVRSPNAEALVQRSTSAPRAKHKISRAEVDDRWMDVNAVSPRPLVKALSGLEVEYRIIQIYSRDAGKREASLAFDVGQGTADIGFRNALPMLFQCRPAVPVRLSILDDDGQPTTAAITVRDQRNRVYPARSRRLEPDFFFHDQIYRHDGDQLRLPAGEYQLTITRGPEYHVQTRSVTITNRPNQSISLRLRRWIHMTKYQWFSGDHHIHAAGCSHYEAPTEGVRPVSMMRHILGEDLNVGCVLTWGPCWYHQKQFFDGKVHQLSQSQNLMRYDVEVSGFPSSHAGHLCLLRLVEDDYPGTTRIEQWPSWDLPVLQWGKEQGGVVGFSHSGWGLEVEGDELPNYRMPRFDGIGANEYIIDVVHDACDFISAVDTPIIWELSPWYHTLNCGFTCRISGETDFPCIYDQRVGLGRSYIKLDGKLDFDAWVQGLKAGRSYVGDGLSHLFDFRVNQLGVGEAGAGGRASFLAAKPGEKLKISVQTAAFLPVEPNPQLGKRALHQQPYWHLERARVGQSRRVPVELIVNGEVVETREIVADGKVRPMEFEHTVQQSSWVALRVFASSHTNPIFVEVDGKPIRVNRRSAQWCLDAVDVCWKSKRPQIRPGEREAAAEAYDHAREVYRQILGEMPAE